MIRRTAGSVLPWLVAVVAVVSALRSAEVGFRDIAVFGSVQLVCYSLPGVLLWRALRGRASSWLHDVTFGTVLAHAVTIGVYIAARWLDVPRAVWLVPAATVVVFVLVPSLRRHWRAGPGEPAWFHWGLASCVVLLSIWFARFPIGLIPLSGQNALGTGADHAFLLSLTGELRHHMPPTTPYVVDEPLYYHWFGLADLAAMSWQGGQELDLLLLRLGPLWAMLNAFVAFAFLGERLAGKKVAGLLAVVLAVFVGSISLLHGAAMNIVDSTLLRINWFGSPTQGVGQLLAIAVLVLAVDLVRREEGGARAWVLFLVLSLALMGAKATFIPVIGAGLLLVATVELVRERRVPRTALAMGSVLAAELAFAQLVLFGGASQGLAIDPGADMRRLGVQLAIPAENGTLPLVAVSAVIVFGWLAPLAGAAMLLLRPWSRAGRSGPHDPATQIVLAMVVSGIVACLLLSHAGYSQYFFLRSGLPFGYLLVACGLVRLPEFLRWRASVPALLLAAVAGGGYVAVALRLTRDQVEPRDAALRALAILGGACAVGAVAWAVGFFWARERHHPGRFALALSCLAVATLAMGAARTVYMTEMIVAGPAEVVTVSAAVRPVPPGGFTAARYVRDRTDPDDLLATNAHCNRPRQTVCDTRAFWMSALTERRFVVEGWAFTATANALAAERGVPPSYWRPELLQLNDALFTDPSPTALDALTDRYPVHWLIVDRRFPADLARLAELLPEHRTFGKVTVFRIPGPTD